MVTTLIIVLVLAGVGIGGYKAYTIMREARAVATNVTDYPGAGEGSVEVEIPDGASGQEIGQILYDKGVVASVGAFADAYAANANSGNIQAGVYTLKARMSRAARRRRRARRRRGRRRRRASSSPRRRRRPSR